MTAFSLKPLTGAAFAAVFMGVALPAIAQQAAPAPVVADAPANAAPAPAADAPLPGAPVPTAGAAAPADPGASHAGSATPAPHPDVAGPSNPATPATVVTQETASAVTPPPAQSGAPLPHALSPWGMFMAADIIVKTVMILLAAASFMTWTVLIYKVIELIVAKGRARSVSQIVRHAGSLPEAAAALSGRKDPGAFMAVAVLDEAARSEPALDAAGNDGLKERAHSIVARIEAQAGRRMQFGTGLLATIGSISPFVGLFGTVWGIMNSFIGISKSQTTNLAVVAPGIAEALLATAIGLVAAIPAVIIYNLFARQIAGYRLILGDAGAGVQRLLSRDLDFRKTGKGLTRASVEEVVQVARTVRR